MLVCCPCTELEPSDNKNEFFGSTRLLTAKLFVVS